MGNIADYRPARKWLSVPSIATITRKLEKEKWDYSDRRKKNPGRPRIAVDIEQLVCTMARANEWGYARIQGELKKLDITISKSSVANILRRNGLASLGSGCMV